MSRWGGRPAKRLVALVLATYGDRCHLCGLPRADSADHVIPRSAGGPDTLANLRPVHHSAGPRCNRRRGALTIAEFRRRHPGLDPDRRHPADPSRDW